MLFEPIKQIGENLAKVSQSVSFNFLNVLDHLRKHTGVVEDVQTKIPRASGSQVYTKRSILSRLGDIFSAVFGGDSSSVKAKPPMINQEKLEYSTKSKIL